MFSPLRPIAHCQSPTAPFPFSPTDENRKVHSVAMQSLSNASVEKKKEFFDFLLPKFPPRQRNLTKEKIKEFLQMHGLTKSFVEFFEEGTKEILQKLPPVSKIFFFKNFFFHTKREGMPSISELTDLTTRLQPHVLGRDSRHVNKILFTFLEKTRESWPYLDASLRCVTPGMHGIRHSGVLYHLIELLPALAKEQWAEFALFLKTYYEDAPLKPFELLYFFKTFSKEQRDLLLFGSNQAIRKALFANTYAQGDHSGLAILLTYTPQEIASFYALIKKLPEMIYNHIFLIPVVFDLKGGRKLPYFIQEFTRSLFNVRLNLENFLFTIDYGNFLHILQLPTVCNTILIPFLDNSFGKETALINFLYDNFVFFANPITKRIVYYDLVYLLDLNDHTLTAKTATEESFLWDLTESMRSYMESLPDSPSAVLESMPSFSYLEDHGFLIDVASGSLLLKKCEKIPFPELLLEVLIDSHLLYLDNFTVYFLDSEPKNIDGILTYAIPPTVDDGGPKREFFYLLLKSLLNSSSETRLEKDEEGFLTLKEDYSSGELQLLINFGILLSRLQKMQIPTGSLLPPKSFELLQFFRKNSRLSKELFFKEIDKILNGSRLLNQQGWSEEDLLQIQTTLALDSPDEVPSSVMEILGNSHEGRSRALWEMFQAFTSEQHFVFQTLAPYELQEYFEGEGIRSALIDQFVTFTTNHPFDVGESFIIKTKNWFEKATKGQIQALTKAITGGTSLLKGQKITFHFCPKDENSTIHPFVESFAHTCDRKLDIFMDDLDRLETLLDEISMDRGFNAL